MFQNGEVVGKSGVVLDANETAKGLVSRTAIMFPSDVGAVFIIGIDPDVIAIVDPEIAGGLRVHLDLPVGDPRRPPIGAMGITEVVTPDPVPIHDRPG